MRSIKYKYLVVALCLSLVVSHATTGVVLYEPGTGDPISYSAVDSIDPESYEGLESIPKIKFPVISIYGTISPGDVEQVRRYMQMAGRYYIVELDSPGGDLYAAMAIGRIIRQDGALVFINKPAVLMRLKFTEDWDKWDHYGICASSCVFILAAGGANRVSHGAGWPTSRSRVGIHRPLDPDDTLTSASQQKLKFAQVEKDVKAYLKEMNVPTELWDQMLMVPPDEIRMLNDDELKRYGLSGADPYWDAAHNAARAKYYGISVEEFLKRRARLRTECTGLAIVDWTIQKYLDCKILVMKGLR